MLSYDIQYVSCELCMNSNYVESIVNRFEKSKAKTQNWKIDDVISFSVVCEESAPLCLCGCGMKTYPDGNNGMSIFKHFQNWISRGTIPCFYERVHNHRYKSVLSKDEFQATIASLLGDGHMNYPHKGSNMPKIRWNMGNKDHALFKMDFFKDFGTTFVEKENPGWGSNWYQVGTGCALAFVDVYDKYRIEDRAERAKAISKDLDEVGWAWYYGDDGHYNKSRGIAFIHTEGLGEDGSNYVAASLNKFLDGDHCKVDSYIGGSPKSRRYMVRLRTEGTRIFLDKIRPHIATGMEYKISA